MHKANLETLLLLIVATTVGLVNAISVEKDLSMTLSQKQALDKFKEQVKPLLYQDYMKTDIYLIRWLRAKNFNLNEAEIMLKENLKWRQEYRIDKIQSEDFSDMREDYPATMDTYDKEGRPIGTIEIYHWDIRQAMLTGKGPRLLRYLDFLVDNITMQVFERQKRGMNVTQWKVLINAEGFNLITHGCPMCVPLWLQLLTGVDKHFHGWLDEFIVIESSAAVHSMLDILRPFLSRWIQDNLKIFGTNKRQWMTYLDQRISRDNRRPRYNRRPFLHVNIINTDVTKWIGLYKM